METGWRTSFNGGDGGGGGSGGGQNSNFTNNYDHWTNYHAAAAMLPESTVIHALLFSDNTTFRNSGVRWDSIHVDGKRPDPHMMCLKLGKRHYCDDGAAVVPVTDTSNTTTGTRWPGVRPASSPVTAVARCQVEGCNVALCKAKEYYKRHKVCEIHSKAPKVVVSGIQQRFCQQCSRFHDVTEFDEAKRSCRRRLEGHNQRRRKGTFSTSLPRNFPRCHENNPIIKRRLGPLSTLPQPPSTSSSQLKPVRALSLLSSPKTEPCMSPGDLSLRCSDALYELIAANRATSVSGHFLIQNSSHQPLSDNAMHTSHDTQMWDRISRTTTTLDVKQPSSGFGFWPFVHEGEA